VREMALRPIDDADEVEDAGDRIAKWAHAQEERIEELEEELKSANERIEELEAELEEKE
jgi:predicted RNase H-like nuclease (RuvC/YqgF family)